jgi:hypothetical protein
MTCPEWPPIGLPPPPSRTSRRPDGTAAPGTFATASRCRRRGGPPCARHRSKRAAGQRAVQGRGWRNPRRQRQSRHCVRVVAAVKLRTGGVLTTRPRCSRAPPRLVPVDGEARPDERAVEGRGDHNRAAGVDPGAAAAGARGNGSDGRIAIRSRDPTGGYHAGDRAADAGRCNVDP